MNKQLDADKLVAHIKRMAEGAAPKSSIKSYVSLYGKIENGQFDAEPEGLQSVEFTKAHITVSVGDTLVCVGNCYKYKVTGFVSFNNRLTAVVVRRFADGSTVELDPQMLDLDLQAGAWEVVDTDTQPHSLVFGGVG